MPSLKLPSSVKSGKKEVQKCTQCYCNVILILKIWLLMLAISNR